jgi:GTP pyrophosphokinase
MGMLSDITHIVSDDFSINMREIQLRSHDGIVEGSLSLYVQDVDSLYSLMDKFRQIKGVESVKRIENATLEE